MSVLPRHHGSAWQKSLGHRNLLAATTRRANDHIRTSQLYPYITSRNSFWTHKYAVATISHHVCSASGIWKEAAGYVVGGVQNSVCKMKRLTWT